MGCLFCVSAYYIPILRYKLYNLCLSILGSILYVTACKFILKCLNGYSIPKSESGIYLYEPDSCSLYMYIFAVNQLWKSCWWRRDRERGREREREEGGREGDTSIVSASCGVHCLHYEMHMYVCEVKMWGLETRLLLC